MDLAHGGHLTHGAPVTRSARSITSSATASRISRLAKLTIEEIILALKHRPKIILAGFSAYPRELDFAKFSEIGNEVGAMLMADMSHIAGLIVGGVLKSLTTDFTLSPLLRTKPCVATRWLDFIKWRGRQSLEATRKTLENLPTLIDRRIPWHSKAATLLHHRRQGGGIWQALQPEFKNYARQIVKNAEKLAEELQKRGFKLVTGGTSNH